MKLKSSFAVALLCLGLTTGCASTGPQRPPSAFEQKFFTILTNYVTEVAFETNAITVTNVVQGIPVVTPALQVVITTNVTPTYEFTPNTTAAATATTSGTATNIFAPGFGGLVTTIIGGVFGLWGTLRSRKANKTSEALAQIIETGQEVLLTVPNGADLAAKWKAWMIKHQAQTGVISEASKLVANVVDTDDARDAAAKITAILNASKA